MHRWSHRYFILNGPHITYKLKPDGPVRGTFDLTPGCALTEVKEDSSSGSKKKYSFWVVWPYDKNLTKHESDEKVGENGKAYESDEDESKQLTSRSSRDLKKIVESEVKTSRENQKRVEAQMEIHKDHDNSVSLGVKVAAVAVGGVVVGALTAGIGLVPYITVVGLTAVAGGGAVAYQYRRPPDSRLILACETMFEALGWKEALEYQISKLEAAKRPMLPPSTDPDIISSIIGMNAGILF